MPSDGVSAFCLVILVCLEMISRFARNVRPSIFCRYYSRNSVGSNLEPSCKKVKTTISCSFQRVELGRMHFYISFFDKKVTLLFYRKQMIWLGVTSFTGRNIATSYYGKLQQLLAYHSLSKQKTHTKEI